LKRACEVGVKTNADSCCRPGAGVNIIQNSGEPGAARSADRVGSSLSATNDPLYVIDGVPIDNVSTEPTPRGSVVPRRCLATR